MPRYLLNQLAITIVLFITFKYFVLLCHIFEIQCINERTHMVIYTSLLKSRICKADNLGLQYHCSILLL
jgi:hypothetical protein